MTIKFSDQCDCTGKEVFLETAEGDEWVLSLVGLPNGHSKFLSIRSNRINQPSINIVLPSEVIEALNTITK